MLTGLSNYETALASCGSSSPCCSCFCLPASRPRAENKIQDVQNPLKKASLMELLALLKISQMFHESRSLQIYQTANSILMKYQFCWGHWTSSLVLPKLVLLHLIPPIVSPKKEPPNLPKNCASEKIPWWFYTRVETINVDPMDIFYVGFEEMMFSLGIAKTIAWWLFNLLPVRINSRQNILLQDCTASMYVVWLLKVVRVTSFCSLI